MPKSIKMPVAHLSLPVPENFTGKVLVNVEKGIAINGFPLRPDEFVGSVDSFIECCRLIGFQVTPRQ
ncbi:TPA: hypothetical protein ACTYPY_005480 [Klebsiella pneumoniae]|uniref:hypothetical protein n=1 Tax=Klebsiella TaxID=570 RepID=UPI001090EDBC|nr:hypothetical protein [Klebsiella pneumoniae]EKZ9860038.1 hypothetical protein [Klebsiella pneumoniae]MBR8624641.1 hypothetical protein [Klebsiella pneumoniae subsp. pneumoniae]MBZ1682526.1 hypothetical protein [Klebsiella pneumoniae]MDZ1607739.1 hypothetical protein [Klebsiella pneumoniae]UMJ82098.1 hypothetical protein JJ436_02340 [Klebsiella pneumoniae]